LKELDIVFIFFIFLVFAGTVYFFKTILVLKSMGIKKGGNYATLI